ncbi:MAG: hypothetical protein C0423_11865 [Methylibium sp.]|nr:hypothetical protein [Methylibium sp.]
MRPGSTGAIAWQPGLLMMVAATTGGFAGARLARKLAVAWVRAGVIPTGLLMSALLIARR